MNILIAEDSIVTGKSLIHILSRFGQCQLVDNGTDTLNKFNQVLKTREAFDLICLDIMLPELDGQDVLRSVRKIEEIRGIHLLDGVKIIMISGLKDKTNIIKAFRRGCESYIIKPVSLKALTVELCNLNLLPGAII